MPGVPKKAVKVKPKGVVKETTTTVILPEPILVAPPVTLPPTTTIQEDITSFGQRRINLIWESTQAIIAVMITAAIIFSGTRDEVLNYAFFLIVSMYFIRTNHKLIGGVGAKPTHEQR